MAATPMPKTKVPAAVDQALAGRRSLNATARKAPGPNMAGGDLNPAVNSQTPPILSPAQRPPAWQALQQAGIGGQGSAAANRAAAAGLQQQGKPAIMPGPTAQEPISLPGAGGGGPGPGDIQPGLDIGFQPSGRHPLNPGGGDQTQGGAPAVDLAGRAPVFGTPGQQLGTAGAMDPGTADNIRRLGGTPPRGAGAPPPGPGGFNANLGADIAQRLSALRMGQGSPQGQGANPDAVRAMGGEQAAMNPALWGQGGAGMGKPPQPSFSDFWASPGIMPTGRGGGINPGVAGGGRDPMTGGIAAGGGFGYGGGGGGGRGGGAPGYY